MEAFYIIYFYIIYYKIRKEKLDQSFIFFVERIE